MDFVQKWWFKLNILRLDLFLQTCSFSLYKTLIDGLEMCGLFVYYCDVFISCLDSHSDGTHSLQRIHWWASDVMLNFSKSVLMKKQTHLHLGWLRVSRFLAKNIFGGEHSKTNLAWLDCVICWLWLVCCVYVYNGWNIVYTWMCVRFECGWMCLGQKLLTVKIFTILCARAN